MKVYRDGVLRATVATPWQEGQLGQIAWAQFGDSLLITHPDVPPQQLKREGDTVWTVGPWIFAEAAPGVSAEPFARFADPDVAMQSTATTGTVTLNTSADVFVAAHLGGIVRMKGKQILLTNIQTTTQAIGLVLQPLADTGPTTDWDEQAFSAARGWPVTVSFHQDRMVIGGSRDLPNGLWLSKTGQSFNFESALGDDDEAIAFRLAASDTPAIRALMPGRNLQVFTSSGEWVVTGDPLTRPTSRCNSRAGSARPGPPCAAARRRWRDPVRGAQWPRIARVPVRRHRAGLSGRRPRLARPASGAQSGRPGVRCEAAAVSDRQRGRLARDHCDLPQCRHRRVESAGDGWPGTLGRGGRRRDDAPGRPTERHSDRAASTIS